MKKYLFGIAVILLIYATFMYKKQLENYELDELITYDLPIVMELVNEEIH